MISAGRWSEGMLAGLKAKWAKKKFTKKEKIGLGALVFGAVFYTYLTFLYDPLVFKYEQKQAELATMQQEIAAAGGRVPDIAGIEATVTEKQTETDQLKQQLVEVMAVRKAADEATASKILAQITGLVVDYRLEMISMTIASPVAETAETPAVEGAEVVVVNIPGAELFDWWQCKLVLRGSMATLSSLANALVQVEQMLIIDRLEWSATEEHGQYQISIRILF